MALSQNSLFPVLVEYGVGDRFVNVTLEALHKCLQQDVLIIPSQDQERNDVFGDPFFGVFKSIRITDQATGEKTVYAINEVAKRTIEEKKNPVMRALHEIEWMHRRLRLVNAPTDAFGSSFILQFLSSMHISPSATVLEIGAGGGYTSLVLASLLSSPDKLVSMECNPAMCLQLQQNQVENHLAFHIENCALGHLPMMQRGLTTLPVPASGVIAEDCELINTTTFQELEMKYARKFNTLVIDCGSAFLAILIDDVDNVLANIQVVIVVSDYRDSPPQKSYVDNMFAKKGLQRVFSYPGPQGVPDFYEVWVRGQEVVLLHC